MKAQQQALQGIARAMEGGWRGALALIGPTASGKTAMALWLHGQLARLGCRVRLINMDSVQCYRELEIGSAKPPAAKRKLFALMDIREPDQAFSVAEFIHLANAEFAKAQLDELPLLVGGSMMYCQALQRGIAKLPPSVADVRGQLQAQLHEHGYAAMYARLARIDPQLAARLSSNDTQRLLRGLEVYQQTGQQLSRLQQSPGLKASVVVHPIVLSPEKSLLNQRINKRLTAMLRAGLVEEVRHLRATYPHAKDSQAMRSVGYRQTWQMLDGSFASLVLHDKILFATRQLAKRQRTWLNQWPDAACIAGVNSAEQCGQLARITGGIVSTSSKMSTQHKNLSTNN